MAEYAAMDKDHQTQIKDIGGFVGGSLTSLQRKATTVDKRCLICLDIDYGDDYVIDDWEMITSYAAVIHTTHSHTPESPRYRIVAPLTRPVTADEYEALARLIASDVGIDKFDSTTFQPSRLMFWPSCPRDASPVAKEITGPWISPDDLLRRYDDWHNVDEWPRNQRERNVRHNSMRTAEDPLTKTGWVGAFCRAYTPQEAIEKFIPEVYSRLTDDRWTYNGGHTVGGAVIYEGKYLYSWHDTDPAHNRCCNAYDLVRIHRFSELDEGYTGDWKNSPSQTKMRELCQEDEPTQAEYDAVITPENVIESPGGAPIFRNELSEQSYARVIAKIYKDEIRYSKALGWLLWTGSYWRKDAESEVYGLILKCNDRMFADAVAMKKLADDQQENTESAKAYYNFARKMREGTKISALEKIIRSLPELRVLDVNKLDADPWALNTPEGTVNLTTGELKPHVSSDFCTKIARYGPKTTDNSKIWLDFVDYITGCNPEVADFLQRAMGMAAVGAIYEEGVLLSYGKGSNGKSTFYGALMDVLGDYATVIAPDVFIRKKGQSASPFSTSDLFGERLVLMSETEAGDTLSVSDLKKLTSSDVIYAQKKYKDAFVFKPTHTTVVQTNHLPDLSNVDNGLRRRITVINFPSTITRETVITNYRQFLVEHCGPDIMQWIVEGAVKFYNDGCKLPKPAAVQQTTDSYIDNEDSVGDFIRDCCVTGPDLRIMSMDIYNAYCNYASQNALPVTRLKTFSKRLEERFEKKRTSKGMRWEGLALKDDMEDTEDG